VILQGLIGPSYSYDGHPALELRVLRVDGLNGCLLILRVHSRNPNAMC
jgi:hypothetical protein